MTTESCIRTRVTLQSHAHLSTVLEETGSENSISAPCAPTDPSRVSIEVVTCS